uniref:LETM1 domain-containing protein n=1 Tax=Elaeophora elaphi TaxID=1147741 RepID=A0A0R3RVC4_9BILA
MKTIFDIFVKLVLPGLFRNISWKVASKVVKLGITLLTSADPMIIVIAPLLGTHIRKVSTRCILVTKKNDADDVETAQSSHQLTEDKKDVALETELETRTPSSSIIGLTFVKAVIIHFIIGKQPMVINRGNI